jgi:hypothetical protein
VTKLKTEKTEKKSDTELFELIEKSIKNIEYVFLPHAKVRLSGRAILEPVVLDILEGKQNTKRKRNKKKDSFKEGNKDWNYCIEGFDPNNDRIRIILSFDEKTMPIITVMWAGKE